MKAGWWKFWDWHFCRCRTNWDDSGIWGECVICHTRYGFVTRKQLRAYADAEVRAAISDAATGGGK